MTALQFLGYFLLVSFLLTAISIGYLIYSAKRAAEALKAAAKAKKIVAAEEAAEKKAELEKQLAEANKEAEATEAEATEAVEGFSNIPSPNDDDFDITKNNFDMY